MDDRHLGGNGGYLADAPGTATPLAQAPTAPNAGGGTGYAVSDETGPSVHTLRQSFTVPAGATQVSLSYQMFVNDFDGGPVADPAGLVITATPNQHARVDLLTASASATSTAAADVVHTFYLGTDPPLGANPHPFLNYSFDITPFVVPGQTYQFRFADVDNRSFMSVGVDNISITAGADTTPPTTTAAEQGLAGTDGWFRTPVTVTLSATDIGSGVAGTFYRINNGPQQTYTGPFSLVTNGGVFAVQYWSVDRVGNAEAPHTLTVMIDGVPPTVAITAGPPAVTNSRTAHFAFAATDTFPGSGTVSGVDHLVYQLDGGPPTSITGSSIDFGNLAEGGHTLSVRAVDRAGNTGPAVTASWTVDRASLLAAAPAGGTYGGTTTLWATLTWHGDGSALADKSVAFTIDGVPVGTATTGPDGVAVLPNVSLIGFDAGTHTVAAGFAGDDGYDPTPGRVP